MNLHIFVVQQYVDANELFSPYALLFRINNHGLRLKHIRILSKEEKSKTPDYSAIK